MAKLAEIVFLVWITAHAIKNVPHDLTRTREAHNELCHRQPGHCHPLVKVLLTLSLAGAILVDFGPVAFYGHESLMRFLAPDTAEHHQPVEPRRLNDPVDEARFVYV